jgi:hypothetical protein
MGEGKWAGAWPMRGKRKGGERRPEEKREGEVSGPAKGFGLASFPFSFLLLSYTQLIQVNLVEFKIQFEFKPINST